MVKEIRTYFLFTDRIIFNNFYFNNNMIFYSKLFKFAFKLCPQKTNSSRHDCCIDMLPAYRS